jgi:hypothetical protein
MSEQLSLDVGIDADAIARATLARHRRIARMSGSSPRVVDAPAYRAMLARHVADAPRVKAHAIMSAATAQRVADAILRLPTQSASAGSTQPTK